LDKYKDQQKQIVTTVNQNNNLIKLKEDLNVIALEADKDKFYNNADKTKGLRYQEWLKFLKTDMHIEASVKVIQEISKSQAAFVKN
jgi:carboxyl-terminal processing protease